MTTSTEAPETVRMMVAKYRSRTLDADAWAHAADAVRATVLAAAPSTPAAARQYLQALTSYLDGPSTWDGHSVPDLLELLTEKAIEDAYGAEMVASKSSYLAVLKTMGRAIGARPPLPAPGTPMDLTPQGVTITFEPTESACGPVNEEDVAHAVEKYAPRRTLSTRDWAVARPAVTALVLEHQPVSPEMAVVLLSALSTFLKDLKDRHVWDGAASPRLDQLLTVKNIAGHVAKRQVKANTAATHRNNLESLGRTLGTIEPLARLRPKPRVYDPFLGALATAPVSVAAIAAAREMADQPRDGKFTLDYIATDIDEALTATARTDDGGTVWAADALVALAEVPVQPPVVPMNSSPQADIASAKPRPLTRKQKLDAAKARVAEKARVKEVEAAGLFASLPDPTSVDEPIRKAVAAFFPTRDDQSVTWHTNRDIAERLVFAYKPKDPKRASNVCSFVATYLTWHLASAEASELDLEEMLAEAGIAAYVARAACSGSTKSSVRAAMRRIRNNVFPHNAPQRLGHREVAAPYAPEECQAFIALAWHQPNPNTRRRVQFIIALSLGAGLDAVDLKKLHRSHITTTTIDDRRLYTVTAPGLGTRGRTVPVRQTYVPLLERALEDYDAAEHADPTAPLISGDPSTVQVVGKALGATYTAGNPLDIKSNRLRNTWLVDVMSSQVPLAHLLLAAGLKSARSLTDLLAFCEPADEADIVAALAAWDGGVK